MSTVVIRGCLPESKETMSGSLRVPASKSHTIRALLLASFAEGPSRIRRPLYSEDALSCLKACRLLGAEIEETGEGWEVRRPVDWRNPKESDRPVCIDVGNSGTTLYLITALAALLNRPVEFDGDDQIRARSAANLLGALTDLGARVEGEPGGCAPYRIKGPLTGGETAVECPTSQYLSALLMALPLLPGGGLSRVKVPLLMERPYAEMTLSWLEELGVRLENKDFQEFLIPGGQVLRGFDKAIPGDFSSATFFFCAAALTGSTLVFEGLDPEDSQGDKAVIGMLEQMGCRSRKEGEALVFSGGPLTGRTLDLNDTPDALPALAAVACYAEGETRLVNVPQARMKETDRIAVMTRELRKMGGDIEERPDGMVIRPAALKGAAVRGHGDHRVVMALAVAALGARGETRIDTAEAVDITFPGFFDLLASLRRDA